MGDTKKHCSAGVAGEGGRDPGQAGGDEEAKLFASASVELLSDAVIP